LLRSVGISLASNIGSAINFHHALSMQMVAEGVETTPSAGSWRREPKPELDDLAQRLGLVIDV
jgi:hypothetical protein